jgi:hypothetical protein
VAHAYTPSYSAVGDWEDHQLRQKVNEIPSQPISRVWWLTSVIPAMREV